jgi:hypothetical protein
MAISSEIENSLTALFKRKGSGPFLFVGSGFSRRYLGLEDWAGLLQKFCRGDLPFEFYLAKANGSLPQAAQLIAEKFNDYWWSSDEYKDSVEKNKSRIKNITSALRLEISDYMVSLETTGNATEKYKNELKILSILNVDGIITTNWDQFLEKIFPDYKIYIGQSELIFSQTHDIGEIYKIHGCCSKPESLVLTNNDYDRFNQRNAYLAAKLITIFVEHPVVFIGYSISDKNISDLLRSISLCIGKENIEKLRENLIFVQRPKEGESDGISSTSITIDGVQIPLILVRTDNLGEIYSSINSVRRKIPSRVLRYCKEQLYEIAKGSTPEKKLCVVGIDEIDEREEVEFLVGIGITQPTAAQFSNVGYLGVTAVDIFHDIIFNDKNFDAKSVLLETVPHIGKATPYIPVFKYLSRIGITKYDLYKESGFKLDKWAQRKFSSYYSKQYAKLFTKKYSDTALIDIISTCIPEHTAIFIPLIKRENIDMDALRNFLIDNIANIESKNSNYSTYFRKAICVYDRYLYGW